jgi:hypothetical protein
MNPTTLNWIFQNFWQWKKKGENMGKYAIKRVKTLHKFKMFRMSIYQVTKMNCHLYACKKICFRMPNDIK